MRATCNSIKPTSVRSLKSKWSTWGTWGVCMRKQKCTQSWKGDAERTRMCIMCGPSYVDTFLLRWFAIVRPCTLITSQEPPRNLAVPHTVYCPPCTWCQSLGGEDAMTRHDAQSCPLARNFPHCLPLKRLQNLPPSFLNKITHLQNGSRWIFRGQGQGWGSFEIRQKYFFPFY
jgi:hypothetical protein